MKLRTKLVLLLSAALLVTMVTSTWLRIRWTKEALESRARNGATATASEIADILERDLHEDIDDDEVSDRLKYELRRHRTVASIGFSFDSDEETTVSFNLDSAEKDPRIRHTPRPVGKTRPPSQRRDEARRALLDHGATTGAPGERLLEPLWRTPDKTASTRWSSLAPRPSATHRTVPRAFLVDLRDEAQKKSARYLEVTVPVDPEGPRRGQLTVRVSLEDIDRLLATEERSSALVTGAAALILMLITTLVTGRVVSRPVGELERAMREVEKGDLSMRVAEGRRDELGALNHGFNAMIARLSEADNEIRAFNRRLAEEVNRATLDLERKNQALGKLNRLLVETQHELGAKERLAALGQLAAQLAHELGTPLSSVSGHLQLALSNKDLSVPLRDRLLVTTRELDRISKIVRDYLDSTRPVAPTRVECNLGHVAEEAIGIALGAAGREGRSVSREIDPSVEHVMTDPGLVRQILVNLITNALDATSSSLPPGHVVISARSSGDVVEIKVADDGVGLPPDDAARIFEPFYTTKGRGKGTGLGLAICRELASALAGRIAVSSAPGAGSTFTVTLPYLTPESRLPV